MTRSRISIVTLVETSSTSVVPVNSCDQADTLTVHSPVLGWTGRGRRVSSVVATSTATVWPDPAAIVCPFNWSRFVMLTPVTRLPESPPMKAAGRATTAGLVGSFDSWTEEGPVLRNVHCSVTDSPSTTETLGLGVLKVMGPASATEPAPSSIPAVHPNQRPTPPKNPRCDLMMRSRSLTDLDQTTPCTAHSPLASPDALTRDAWERHAGHPSHRVSL